MTNINIGVYGTKTPILGAEVLHPDSGGRFIVLRMDEGLTLILNGRDDVAIAHARALATCLTSAADEIEAQLPQIRNNIVCGVTSGIYTEPSL